MITSAALRGQIRQYEFRATHLTTTNDAPPREGTDNKQIRQYEFAPPMPPTACWNSFAPANQRFSVGAIGRDMPSGSNA
jgi:hypothetical protein